MKYNYASDLIFFRPVIKLKNINNSKAIFDFEQIILFIICQKCGAWVVCAIWFSERGVIGSQSTGDFLLASGFIWNYFSHKKNQHHIRYLLLYLLNATPTQVNHDLTCCHNCRRDEGEEVNQDENRAGVCCKGKGWKDGE